MHHIVLFSYDPIESYSWLRIVLTTVPRLKTALFTALIICTHCKRFSTLLQNPIVYERSGCSGPPLLQYRSNGTNPSMAELPLRCGTHSHAGALASDLHWHTSSLAQQIHLYLCSQNGS